MAVYDDFLIDDNLQNGGIGAILRHRSTWRPDSDGVSKSFGFDTGRILRWEPP